MNHGGENSSSYSSADIRRYLEGGMLPAEMHAIEKAALEDPFLADAIEGMRMLSENNALPAFDSDIAELRQRIKGKRRSKIAAWWKVAAAAVVVLVASLFLFNPKEKVILSEARQRQTPDVNRQKPDVRRETEETVILSEAKDQQRDTANQKRQKPDEKRQTPDVRRETDDAVILSEAKEQQRDTANQKRQKPDEKRQTPDVRRETDDAVILSEAKDQQRETANQERQKSDVRRQTDDGVILSEAKDQERQTASISTEKQPHPSIAESSKNAPIPQSQTDTLNITMQPAETELNEVVVVGYPTRNKSSNDGTLRTFSKRFEPAGGWESFQHYVDSSKTLSAPPENNLEIVSFVPGENGRPTQFRIIQSISREHDNETLRILENGPNWKITKGKKRRLTLKFQF